MADNKIVLNVPGQPNVDPSEVTHEALPLKDPLSGRDTDTGNLDRLDDTRTKKTVKIKPVSDVAPIPAIKLEAPATVSNTAAAATPAVPTESARMQDVLSSRDTDTGSLNRLDDTKTKKTVKLSPLSSGGGPVPVVKLGTLAPTAANTGIATVTNLPRPVPSPAINTESIPITTLPTPAGQADDDTRTRQTVILKKPSSPAINTESIPITALPTPAGQADDDTRTRQTVMLKKPSSPAINTESIPITTLPTPAGQADDDTRTRQSVMLKKPLTTTNAVNTESVPLSDLLTGRDTDTGNLERMDDTKTRKTIKLAPLAASGPISKLTPIAKSAGYPAPVTLPKPGSPPVNLAATVELKPVSVTVPAAPPVNMAETIELKPIKFPVPVQPVPVTTDTGSLKDVLDTATRKTVKLQPLPAAAPVAAPAAAPVAAPAAAPVAAPAAAPAPTAQPVSTDTGSLKDVLNTATRKTVKLQPLPASGNTVQPVASDMEKTVVNPIVPEPVQSAGAAHPPDAEPAVAETGDETVKLLRPHAATSAPSPESSSPFPAVAQAKTVVPGAKQTIKLRPSTGGTEEPAPATTIKSAAGTSKDTIKISPLATPAAGIAPSPSAPTLNLAPKTPAPPAGVSPSAPTLNLAPKTPAPPAGVSPSAPTLNLAPKTPAPAPAVVAPSSATVSLSAPSGLTLKKPALTPAPATLSANEQKPELSLANAPAVKPLEPETPVVEEIELEATDEEAENTKDAEVAVEEKKGGLQLKKRDASDEPQGPPRVQTDLEKIEDSQQQFKSDAAGQPSMLYFALALVSVICLAASTYISAAQYVNYWQQVKIKSKLPVSFVSQFVK